MRQYRFNINIPRKTIKKYLGDKSLWDLFVLSVCLKLNSESSGIPNVTERKIRELFHCGVEKAKRMLREAKQCEELFFYDPRTNYLAARNFKRDAIRIFKYYIKGVEHIGKAAYCFKLRFTKGDKISHRAVSRMLRDKLWEQAIAQKERRDDFLSIGLNSHPERKTFLSQSVLSKIAKCHRTTISRHIKAEEANKVLSVERSKPIPVRDFRTFEWLTDDERLRKRKLFLSRRLECLVCLDPYQYHLLQPSVDTMWTNVIFNHKKRQARNYSKRELALGHLWI